MSFALPHVLWLLLLPLGLLVWELRRHGHPVRLPLDGMAAPGRGLRLAGALVRAANLLPALVLAIVVVLIAGPQRSGGQAQVRELTNIEICLDLSGSMTAPFGEGSRYDAAMRAVDAFCRQRKGDAFGLTVFGNEVLRWTPLTTDLDAIAQSTPWLRPERMPRQFGGTQIAKALEACLATVSARPDGDRMVILVSDGQSGDFTPGRAEGLARDFAAAEVVLYMVFVGEDGPDEGVRTIAAVSGGQVFPVDDETALAACFGRIDTLRPARIRPIAAPPEDLRPPVALLAALFGALHCLCLLGLRWTPW
jgi:Ca-activated chloride channel family protein